MNELTFWTKVRVGNPDECWPWVGARNNGGYGTVCFRGRTSVAHRVAKHLADPAFPIAAPRNKKGGGFLLHSCDYPRCCNPRHLRVGTFSDNMYEAYERNRKTQPKGEKHANAKLTNTQASDLRAKYAAGLGDTYTLATEYGISQRAVWLIVSNRTYVHG